eukprot:761781-Hanusia_phi.AAC.1
MLSSPTNWSTRRQQGVRALAGMAGGGAGNKRALCILAEVDGQEKRRRLMLQQGFEEMEAVAPIDILRRASVEVTVASLSQDRLVKGRNGISGADLPL